MSLTGWVFPDGPPLRTSQSVAAIYQSPSGGPQESHSALITVESIELLGDTTWQVAVGWDGLMGRFGVALLVRDTEGELHIAAGGSIRTGPSGVVTLTASIKENESIHGIDVVWAYGAQSFTTTMGYAGHLARWEGRPGSGGSPDIGIGIPHQDGFDDRGRVGGSNGWIDVAGTVTADKSEARATSLGDAIEAGGSPDVYENYDSFFGLHGAGGVLRQGAHNPDGNWEISWSLYVEGATYSGAFATGEFVVAGNREMTSGVVCSLDGGGFLGVNYRYPGQDPVLAGANNANGQNLFSNVPAPYLTPKTVLDYRMVANPRTGVVTIEINGASKGSCTVPVESLTNGTHLGFALQFSEGDDMALTRFASYQLAVATGPASRRVAFVGPAV